MVPDLEKARVTELQVRMDCNGCMQKIRRAMHSINGVYDVYFDFAQQKLKVVGRADPEQILRAIKKTRKMATICSHTEQGEPEASEPPPPAEPAASSDTPPPDSANQPPSEPPPAEADPAKESPLPENEVKPSPDAAPAEPKDVEEIHMVHHYPHGYVYREHWNNYPPTGHAIRHESPYYVTHSYNSYRPSPYVSGYVPNQLPRRDNQYGGSAFYGDHYEQTRSSGDGNNIISMFSDENPNACRIA